MKKTLLFIFSLLTLSLWAQDGINYQGAATDANGDELTNQNITIRASVLSTSASGNLEWEETHSTTTDQFGLFNVVIGQGTNTTNGATALFDDMDWGSGNHYLKIEMDATGGTNYAMIGTTQMMSVPYALYAKSAGIDSTMLANMIGSSGGGMGGGCDFQFPDGLSGVAITYDLGSSDYTVPVGKNLYITGIMCTNGSIHTQIDGISVSVGEHNFSNKRGAKPIIASAGQVISISSAISSNFVTFNGILVDTIISPITYDLGSSNYTVPVGKNLYITGIMCTNGSIHTQIDGISVSVGEHNFSNKRGAEPIIASAGQVISISSAISGNIVTFNGYLADENYFAGCGGGGSSSGSAGLDSAMVAGMIANAGGVGSNLNEIDTLCYNYNASYLLDTITIQEDGFLFVRRNATQGQQAVYYIEYGYNLEEQMYMVGYAAHTEMIPMKSDMKIYIWGTNYNNTNLDVFFIPNNGGGSSSSASSIDSAMVASMIANNGGGSNCNLYYPDGLANTELVSEYISYAQGNSYTVPTGKNLYVGAHNGFYINGTEFVTNSNYHIIVGSGDVITAGINFSPLYLDGFLVDANVDPMYLSAPSSSFTVPSNKKFVLIFSDSYAEINGKQIAYTSENSPIIVDAGDLISNGSSSGNYLISGYLVDENYFAGCGGGGGSSSTSTTINYDSLVSVLSTDSTFLANIAASSTNNLSIGDSYGGGKVAYIFQPGDIGYSVYTAHGIIISDVDMSATNFCFNTNTCTGAQYSELVNYNVTHDEIGAALMNQSNYLLMRDAENLEYCDTSSIMYLSSIAEINGYSDWLIPTTKELEEIALYSSLFGMSGNYGGQASPNTGNLCSVLISSGGGSENCYQGYPGLFKGRLIRYF